MDSTKSTAKSCFQYRPGPRPPGKASCGDGRTFEAGAGGRRLHISGRRAGVRRRHKSEPIRVRIDAKGRAARNELPLFCELRSPWTDYGAGPPLRSGSMGDLYIGGNLLASVCTLLSACSLIVLRWHNATLRRAEHNP